VKERLYRFEYDDPPYIVYVTRDVAEGPLPPLLPEPDRIVDAGEWELVVTEKEREEGKAS